MRISHHGWSVVALAASLSLATTALADVNTINDGAVVQGGAYFNTPDGKTTFKNSAGGGLWLKSGSNVRGLEVNAAGDLTNNGGTIHLYAPGDVVRLDGNIDVRGIRNPSGAYLGNGGNVFVDSAYLYQSGNIYANGVNGGLVQMNVGAATLTGNARIEAKGSVFGEGGIVAINASGPVDLQRRVVIDTTGRVSGTYDTTIINIEGGLVNVEGVLRAGGFVNRGEGSGPGGTIRLVATGQTDVTQARRALQTAVQGGTFSADGATSAGNRLNQLKTVSDGDIIVAGGTPQGGPAVLSAPGGFGQSGTNDPTDTDMRSGDGGTIILTAQRNIHNRGWILANGGDGTPRGPVDDPNVFTNGGNGGTISLNAGQNIVNTGRVVADGGAGGLSIDLSRGLNGGDAGLIAFSYGNQMPNPGVVRAIGGAGASVPGEDPLSQGAGGHGGLVVFSGPRNPNGNGVVVTFGGPPGGPTGTYGALGSIVAPNPATTSNTLLGIWRKTDPIELLTHHENLILLGNALPISDDLESELQLFDSWTRLARVRSTADAKGQFYDLDRGPALDEFGNKISADDYPTPVYPYRNFIFANGTSRPIFFLNPNQLTRGFVRKIFVTPFNTMTMLSGGYIGLGSVGGDIEAIQFGNGPGGGRLSLIAANFGQRYPLYVNGGLSGGSVHIAASGQLDTGGALGPVLNTNLSTGGTLHGGSIMLKAGREMRSLITGGGLMQANGGLAGGNIQLLSRDRLSNFGTMQANGGITGGSILLQAINRLSNASDSPKRLEANGGDYGGNITLRSPQMDPPPAGFLPIELQVTGGIQNGEVVIEP